MKTLVLSSGDRLWEVQCLLSMRDGKFSRAIRVHPRSCLRAGSKIAIIGAVGASAKDGGRRVVNPLPIEERVPDSGTYNREHMLLIAGIISATFFAATADVDVLAPSVERVMASLESEAGAMFAKVASMCALLEEHRGDTAQTGVYTVLDV